MAFSTADFRSLVDSDMPGFVEATIAGVPVDALFASEYAEALGIVGNHPALKCVPVDVASIAQGAAVTVDVTGYTVSAIERNPNKLTVLRLQRAA